MNSYRTPFSCGKQWVILSISKIAPPPTTRTRIGSSCPLLKHASYSILIVYYILRPHTLTTQGGEKVEGVLIWYAKQKAVALFSVQTNLKILVCNNTLKPKTENEKKSKKKTYLNRTFNSLACIGSIPIWSKRFPHSGSIKLGWE